jgi:tRNA (cmo5U34)-methyltransferase
MESSLGYLNEQDTKWKFDENVTSCFEDMLERSIPQYHVMRNAVLDLGVKVLDNTGSKYPDIRPAILDIGCSNGLGLAPLVDFYGKAYNYRGIDVSAPMIEEARKRFEKMPEVEIMDHNIIKGLPVDSYGLIMSVLTIQFTPIEYRQKIIQEIYDNLIPSGGFIMVEKVLGNCAELNDIMVDTYLKLKEENGYTREQIERKKLSLEGVLVPVTSNWNKDLLKQAGFKKIDVFWRWMNFEGYIALK